MKLAGVLFDFIGTVVKERDPKTVNRCFELAFWDLGLEVDAEFIQSNRGRNKREVFELYTKRNDLDGSIAQNLYETFSQRLYQELDNFEENEGVDDIFKFLHALNIRVGVGTGLSRDLYELITERLEWSKYKIDFIGIAEEIGKGRPNPIMIFRFMELFDIKDPSLVLKIGDTESDIQEGKNASVVTIALDSGTQPRQKLMESKPDYIIDSLLQLREIIS